MVELPKVICGVGGEDNAVLCWWDGNWKMWTE